MAELINPDNYQDFTLEMLKTPDGISKLNAILKLLAQNISSDTESVKVYQGIGTPEGSVAAGVGSLYMRTDGGSDTSVYRKESGSGNTGWVAVTAPAALPLSLANGGTGVALADPNADRIIFWDDSAGQTTFLTPGTGLTISGTTITSGFQDYAAGTYRVLGPSKWSTIGTTATYTKILEYIVPRAGTLTIKFWLMNDNAGQPGLAKIYRNGSAVGTEQSSSSGTAEQFSEDIAGWSSGDLLQLYVKSNNGNSQGAGFLEAFSSIPTIEGANTLGGFLESGGVTVYSGATSPTGFLNAGTINNTGNVGDLYMNTGGGASTTLYVKTAATTWTAK